ncbi:MAG TPA: hypothetical protein PK819_12900, partial [Thermomicrobiales bacterium]|nr:hypothetical protein [Thermomicrobiales bacterium]
KKLGRIDAVLSGGMVLAVVAWFLLAARLTYGNFNGDCPANSAAQFGCRQPDAADLDHWWLLIIPPSLFLLALGFGVIRRGWRTTALVGLAAAILVLGLLELRVAWRLSYTNPDVPVEMMVYTQTSPDLKQAVNEANQLSLLLAPDGDGEVLFDTTGLAWPLWWYFRDNPLAISTGTTVLPQDTNAAVLFLPISTGNSPENAEVLANYTGVEHPFRWHFPEEIYRFFALAPELPMGRSAWISVDQPHGPLDVIRSVIDSSASVFSAQGQTDAFRIVVYRDLNDLVGYYPFQLYIRNDLLPEFGQIRY